MSDDDIKKLVKRLRDMLPQSVGPKAADALEALVAERDSLREVIDHMSFNWIDCSDCDRNREMMKSFIKEEKKEI